ncbi:hypothetical protein D9756_009614 [Leucocoprinus leucothites]|uniref:DUF833-domain-containing protein n=1 Tax=Leucocoprinus leucothites TaxID=201217 RepID=A0A8H5CXU8_9AGAR|nr:hypothetical protein D9756_009614 [Leucoagaricus leucothites]
MCIGVWTLEHPDYALILCTNRDEYLDRPTQDAHFHSFLDDPYSPNSSSVSGNILSGRDAKAGGSWFGLNRAGRVALITNITEPPKSFTSSRGHLVSSFLLSDSSSPLEDEVGKIVPSDAKFAGFNLLLLVPTPPSTSTVSKGAGTSEGRVQEPRTDEAIMSSREQKLSYDAMLVTNHGAGGRLEARRLIPTERACGCMSNGIDGQGGNEWPKVKQATSDFEHALRNQPTDSSFSVTENTLMEKLFDILTWRSPNPVTERAQLRNTVQVTPIPVILKTNGAKEAPSGDPSTPVAAAVSVSNPGTSDMAPSARPLASVAPGFEHYYGTRLSTVLLIRRDGSVLFIERDIWRLGKDGKPERLDYSESRGESDVKQRVFEFKLDWK